MRWFTTKHGKRKTWLMAKPKINLYNEVKYPECPNESAVKYRLKFSITTTAAKLWFNKVVESLKIFMNRFSKTFSAGPNKSSKSAAFNSCSDTSASDTVEIHKRLASEILLSTILSKGKQLKRFVLFFQLEQLQ